MLVRNEIKSLTLGMVNSYSGRLEISNVRAMIKEQFGKHDYCGRSKQKKRTIILKTLVVEVNRTRTLRYKCIDTIKGG